MEKNRARLGIFVSLGIWVVAVLVLVLFGYSMMFVAIGLSFAAGIVGILVSGKSIKDYLSLALIVVSLLKGWIHLCSLLFVIPIAGWIFGLVFIIQGLTVAFNAVLIIYCLLSPVAVGVAIWYNGWRVKVDPETGINREQFDDVKNELDGLIAEIGESKGIISDKNQTELLTLHDKYSKMVFGPKFKDAKIVVDDIARIKELLEDEERNNEGN